MKTHSLHANSLKAFTLVETLVAISIITITLLGPFHAIEQAIIASFIARDETLGSSLAQEAIEGVREIRANNYLATLSGSSNTWLSGLDGTNGGPNCFAPALCTIDVNPAAANMISVCDDGVSTHNCQNVPLYSNTSSGLYNQSSSGSVATRFYRTIQLLPIPPNSSNTEAQLIVNVSWSTNGKPNATIITTYLTNWL